MSIKRQKGFIYFLNYITSLGGRASITFTRFLRFGTSSSFTLMIDILLLALLVELFNIYYLHAAGISFIFSSSINYLINRRWSFRGTYTGLIKGYVLFLFFSIFGVFLTVFLMWILVDLLFFNYLIGRVIAAIIEGTITFLTNHHYTFKMPDVGVDKEYFKT